MATLSTLNPAAARQGNRWTMMATVLTRSNSAVTFGAASMALAVVALVLASYAPIAFSIATVFLFAGPHNLIELRYFLSRTPSRLGKLRLYFILAFAGVIGITSSFAALSWSTKAGLWNGVADRSAIITVYGALNCILIAWVGVMIFLRKRRFPVRNWYMFLLAPAAVMALNCWSPTAFGLALVYLHPLVGLCILDRELARRRPQWRSTYHACLALLPLMLLSLWLNLSGKPAIPVNDELTWSIVNHAGARILPGVSSHSLVATHTFLEMIHYGVWLLAIPIVALSGRPLGLDSIPLALRSARCRLLIKMALGASAVLVVALWLCFWADYLLTREVYFTLAMLHVLAEIPVLLRAL